MTEQFANNALTTLNGSITSTATTLLVSSASLFPSSPQFRILVDSEVMLVTGVAGTTFTVSRGVENTTQVAHNSGATVAQILTVGAIRQAQADAVSVGPFANRPAVGLSTGSVYYTTDGPIRFAYDGYVWRPLIDGYVGTTPPAANTWTQINQAGRSTSFADYKGGLQFSMTNGTTGVDIRLAKRAQPSSHWQITAHLLPAFPNAVVLTGVGARNSSNGSLAVFSINTGSGGILQLHRLTASDTGSSPTISQNTAVTITTGIPFVATGSGYWFRLKNDGTTLTFYESRDGLNFGVMTTETLSTFLTTGDEITLHIFYSDTTQRDFSTVFDSILIESV